jgi:3'(2'), 5'-bisphosphate nucleotidase
VPPLNSPDVRPEHAVALMLELTALVAKASAVILGFAKPPPRRKADGSPVTDADEAAEEEILRGLARLLPGMPVVAEESLGRQAARAPVGTFVLVDALDGTKEFVAGRHEYTVNVALISARTPIAGVVAAPGRGLLWRGIVGHGAERLAMDGGTAGAPERIKVRQWPSSGAVALVSRSHDDAATEALLERLPPTQRESCGSSLKFCRLAEGTADLYPRLGPTSEWDIAAGHALVVAAGGMVTAPDGGPLAYGNADRKFVVRGFVAWGDPAKARSV